MYKLCAKLAAMARIFRRNTRIVPLSALVLVAALAAFGWANEAPQPPQEEKKTVSEEIRTRRLVIVDHNGEVRGAFGIMPDGESRLELRDKQSQVRTWLGQEAAGLPSLAVIGSDDKPLIELGSVEGKAPVFVLRDSAGKRRVAFGVDLTDSTFFMVNDNYGKKRCLISIDKKGPTQLTLFDTSAEPRASVSVEKNGTSGLDLFDADGRPCVTIQVDDKGKPALVAFDSQGKAIWSVPHE